MPYKKALVAGGAGFLGSHMCDHLIEKGYDVTCLDNLQTGTIQNISHLKEHPQFHFIEHDICHPLTLSTHFDEIYNFACAASPPLYQKDPIHTLKTNVIGALHLLELATSQGAKIFQSSTSEIYGDPLEHPQKETYLGHVNLLGIRACYDEGKRCAETLFFNFHRMHKTRIKIGRIFNTYGPRMDPQDGRVVSNFIVQALQAAPITLYGQGSQTRSFCYVSDLIEAIYQLMQSPDDVIGPINLGNPEEYTVKNLADLIVSLIQSSSLLCYKELPEDDPKRRNPDITLAKQILGWQPSVSLEKGLETTISYFKERLLKESF